MSDPLCLPKSIENQNHRYSQLLSEKKKQTKQQTNKKSIATKKNKKLSDLPFPQSSSGRKVKEERSEELGWQEGAVR